MWNTSAWSAVTKGLDPLHVLVTAVILSYDEVQGIMYDDKKDSKLSWLCLLTLLYTAVHGYNGHWVNGGIDGHYLYYRYSHSVSISHCAALDLHCHTFRLTVTLLFWCRKLNKFGCNFSVLLSFYSTSPWAISKRHFVYVLQIRLVLYLRYNL